MFGYGQSIQPSEAEMSPTIQGIRSTAFFAEPLVPIGTTTTEETAQLAAALESYAAMLRQPGDRTRFDSLSAFISSHPQSAWRPSLFLNMGLTYRKTGNFSKALAALQAAWQGAKSATSADGRAVGDAAGAHLSQMYAYIGRREELGALLEELRERPTRGTATELISESSRGLANMQERPDKSFKCGPYALSRILLHTQPQPSKAALKVLDEAKSTVNGLSLDVVHKLSQQAGLNYQIAFREPGSSIITPAVVHWKLDHYAALVAPTDERFLILDSTFGDNVVATAQTIDEEATGYFLVPQGDLPAGWRKVGTKEASNIRGRGDTGDNRDNQATPPTSACDTGGCTSWSYHAMVVGLALHDTPISYKPPVGQKISFQLHYAHRDAMQPQIFNYTNFGPKWTSNWISYVDDNIDTGLSAQLFGRGGGGEQFSFASTTSDTSIHGPLAPPNNQRTLTSFSQSKLQRLRDATGKVTGFSRTLKDGSVETFTAAVGNRYFMTATADPHGNTVSIGYDAQHRISTITDAIGQATRLAYGDTDPLRVTRVTDPFGRSASFTYNASGQLETITDTIGIVSRMTYGRGDFVSALTTPYGTATFTYADSTTDPAMGSARVLEATDYLGQKTRVEFNHNPTNIAAKDPVGEFPDGLGFGNELLNFRNTFVWNPAQYVAGVNGSSIDYQKATIFHWHHTLTNATSRVPSSIKEPLTSRVWFRYPDQFSQLYAGSIDLPDAVARIDDNGRTQTHKYEYNNFGRVTKQTDPAGREISTTYAPTGIDVTEVRNTTAGRNDRLASITYNDRHLPVSVTGANGAPNNFEYNAQGQITKAINALGDATTYTYNSKAQLTSVQGPVAGALFAYTYDAVGRLATATDPSGVKVSFAYDDADRPTQVTFPDGTAIKYGYHLLDLASVTDRMGNTTLVAKDALRRTNKVTDALGNSVEFAYAPSGGISTITDQRGNKTQFDFDIQGRTTRKLYADGTFTSFTYGAMNGALSFKVDAKNQQTIYTHNIDQSIKDIIYANAVVATPTVTFTYDPAYPRVTSMTDGIGTTQYTYHPADAANATPGANMLAQVVSPVAGAANLTDTVSYSYDALNHVTRQNVNGSPEDITFDALGRISTVSNALDVFSYGYVDGTAKVASVKSTNGPQASYSYYDATGDGMLKKINYASNDGLTNLASFAYTYDPNANVTTFTQTYLGQQFAALAGGATKTDPIIGELIAAGLNAKLAIANNESPRANGGDIALTALAAVASATLLLLASLISRGIEPVKSKFALYTCSIVSACLIVASCGGGSSSSGAGVNPPPTSPTAQVTAYYYDKMDRLIGAAVGTNAAPPKATTLKYAYTYDAASNLTVMSTDGVSKLQDVTETNSLKDGVYDANGNPISIGADQYTWDAANRMTSLTRGDVTSEFVYDGYGRTVEVIDKKLNSPVSNMSYGWCGTQRCIQRNQSINPSAVTRRYFREGFLDGSDGYFHIRDALGSVMQTIDRTGARRGLSEFDPYGNTTKHLGDITNNTGYAGYFHHDFSNHNLAVYRSFSPSTGRWINRDPIEEHGGINIYSYVSGRTTVASDPLGLWGFIGAGAGAVAGGVGGFITSANADASASSIATSVAVGTLAGGLVGFVFPPASGEAGIMAAGMYAATSNALASFTGQFFGNIANQRNPLYLICNYDWIAIAGAALAGGFGNVAAPLMGHELQQGSALVHWVARSAFSEFAEVFGSGGIEGIFAGGGEFLGSNLSGGPIGNHTPTPYCCKK